MTRMKLQKNSRFKPIFIFFIDILVFLLFDNRGFSSHIKSSFIYTKQGLSNISIIFDQMPP